MAVGTSGEGSAVKQKKKKNTELDYIVIKQEDFVLVRFGNNSMKNIPLTAK